jgi:hypothetical protein
MAESAKINRAKNIPTRAARAESLCLAERAGRAVSIDAPQLRQKDSPGSNALSHWVQINPFRPRPAFFFGVSGLPPCASAGGSATGGVASGRAFASAALRFWAETGSFDPQVVQYSLLTGLLFPHFLHFMASLQPPHILSLQFRPHRENHHPHSARRPVSLAGAYACTGDPVLLDESAVRCGVLTHFKARAEPSAASLCLT